jgi:hypothetical protein
MIIVILSLVFFACVAMLVREGLWSNALTLINVVTAGLIATSYWEPLATWLDGQFATFTYLLDFIAIWTLFVLAFVILRAITDSVSKVRVKFKTPVEYAGGVIFSLWVGWVMVCFTTMTLHLAPLSADFMGGALSPEPRHNVLLGFAPDHQWLAFVHRVTGDGGALSTSAADKSDATNTFDPRGEFVIRYGQRRVNFEATSDLRVNR